MTPEQRIMLDEQVLHWRRIARENAGETRGVIAKDYADAIEAALDHIAALEADNLRLTEAMRDAAGALAGAASAYRTYAKRYSGLMPKAETDALFTTRAADFDRAAERARRAIS